MLSKRINASREKLGLSKVDFATELGMTSHAVYEWEYNKVNIKESSLRLIESTFNVNPEWLRNGKGNMFTAESTSDLSPELEKMITWMKSLSPQEQTWLEIELKDKISKYKEWAQRGR